MGTLRFSQQAPKSSGGLADFKFHYHALLMVLLFAIVFFVAFLYQQLEG